MKIKDSLMQRRMTWKWWIIRQSLQVHKWGTAAKPATKSMQNDSCGMSHDQKDRQDLGGEWIERSIPSQGSTPRMPGIMAHARTCAVQTGDTMPGIASVSLLGRLKSQSMMLPSLEPVRQGCTQVRYALCGCL